MLPDVASGLGMTGVLHVGRGEGGGSALGRWVLGMIGVLHVGRGRGRGGSCLGLFRVVGDACTCGDARTREQGARICPQHLPDP